MEESDADGEERGDRVAAALHEPAQRDRALVRAGAQAEKHEDHREQQRRQAEERDPEPRRDSGHEEQSRDAREAGADGDAEQRARGVPRVTSSGTSSDAGSPMNANSASSTPATTGATPAMSTRIVGSHAKAV